MKCTQKGKNIMRKNAHKKSEMKEMIGLQNVNFTKYAINKIFLQTHANIVCPPISDKRANISGLLPKVPLF